MEDWNEKENKKIAGKQPDRERQAIEDAVMLRWPIFEGTGCFTLC